MLLLQNSIRLAAAGLLLLLASCASQKPLADADKEGKFINPYPPGTYEHFKAESTY